MDLCAEGSWWGEGGRQGVGPTLVLWVRCLSFLGVKSAPGECRRVLSAFPFFRLELDFFRPEFRLMIYDTGSPVGPGVPGSINSISSAINGPQPGIGRESCLAAPAEPAAL